MNENNKISLPHILEGEDKSSPFANRLRNHYRHIRKWAKRTSTNCFRIYDREINHYPFAIDYYGGRYCIHYFSPNREEQESPLELKEEIENILFSILGAEPSSIFWRTRVKREKTEQYEKTGESKDFFTVLEYGATFKVNLIDYLDTGLFLDHRETRQLVAAACKGKRLLNLFAYTCAFSVHAAMGGAAFTKSVDMSNTYLTWGKDNFILNSLSLKNNELIRADCLKFLDEEIHSKNRYDVIILDPPTISRSKKMDQMFDIQEDYIFLINKSLQLLSEGGILFFSTNSRKFAFDQNHFEHCSIEDISKKTLPIDFHDPKIHRCWKMTLKK